LLIIIGLGSPPITRYGAISYAIATQSPHAGPTNRIRVMLAGSSTAVRYAVAVIAPMPRIDISS
jgi:hypothetical protein